MSGEMYIVVKIQKNESVTLRMRSRSTVENVKMKLHELGKYPLYQQRLLIFNGKVLDDGRALAYYNIRNESTLHLLMRLGGWQPPIYVKTSTWKIISVEYSPECRVYQIKSKVEEVEGIPRDSQMLLFAGKELEDQCTLMHYKINAASTLHLLQHSVGDTTK